jgi:hypothetical protein
LVNDNIINWNPGDLAANLGEFDGRVEKALAAIMEFEAPNVESHAKQTAPWRDQTGNARGSLTARSFIRGRTYGIRLSHGVPYGIWLEVRFAGRYAVILPTIQAKGPQVMETATLLFSRL